jgi:hypothetical protein
VVPSRCPISMYSLIPFTNLLSHPSITPLAADLRLHDFADEFHKLKIDAVERLPTIDAAIEEGHRRVLVVGDVFKKHVTRMTNNRFICSSIDLKKVIWSKSRDEYYKGKFKGEIKVEDIIEIRKGANSKEFKIPMFASTTKRQELDATSFSIVTSSRTLDLEASDKETCIEFYRAFKWLLKAHNTLVAQKKLDLEIEKRSVEKYEFSENEKVGSPRPSESSAISVDHVNIKKVSFISDEGAEVGKDNASEGSAKDDLSVDLEPVKGLNEADLKSHNSMHRLSPSDKMLMGQLHSDKLLMSQISSAQNRKTVNWSGPVAKTTILKKQLDMITSGLNRLNDEMKAALQLINPDDAVIDYVKSSSTQINMSEYLPAAAYANLEKTTKLLISSAISAATSFEATTENLHAKDPSHMNDMEVFKCLISEIRERRAEDTRAMELTEALHNKEAEIKALRHYISEGGSGVCAICSHKVTVGTADEMRLRSLNDSELQKIAGEPSPAVKVEIGLIQGSLPTSPIAVEVVESSTSESKSSVMTSEISNRNYGLDLNKGEVLPVLSKLTFGSLAWTALTYLYEGGDVVVSDSKVKEGGLVKQKMKLNVMASGVGGLEECSANFKADNIIYAVLSAITDGRPSAIFITWIGPKIGGMQRAKVAFHESKILDFVRDNISAPIVLRPTCFEEVSKVALEKSIMFSCRKLGISQAWVCGSS